MKKILFTILIFVISGSMACAEDSTNSTPVNTKTTKTTIQLGAMTIRQPYNADGDEGSWTNSCNYYATNNGTCKAAGPVPINYVYIGYNYQATCKDGEVMVGFTWGKWAQNNPPGSGSRYALLPKCRVITIADLPT